MAKGKSVKTFQPKGRASSDLVGAMLGPTGNLRAPTLRAGKIVIVGFNEDEYATALL